MDAEAVKRSLEVSGLRCTPQRYAVMAFLMEHHRHPTAAKSSKPSIAWIPALPGPRFTTICGTWCRRAWCAKWPSKAAPRASMPPACRITTSSATAAATSRTWSGTTCPGLPRASSVNGFFANANSIFRGLCTKCASRRAPAEPRRRVNTGGMARPWRFRKWENADEFIVRHSCFTVLDGRCTDGE